MSRRALCVGGLAFVLFLAPFGVGAFVATSLLEPGLSATLPPNGLHAPATMAPAGSTAGTFAFVSSFEDGGLDGWTTVAGKAPTVTTKMSYSGEPVLSSSASSGPQIDIANAGFIPRGSFLSFQVAMHATRGTGYFGIQDSAGNSLAVVGVSAGEVWAGPDFSTLVSVGSVPTGTAYPDGWVYLTANLFNASTKLAVAWSMQLFVDRTDVVAAQVTVPNAWAYAAAFLETTSGTVGYSDIVVSTYEIPIFLPGYNNMMGYGQGSGLLVQLLPAYYRLTAEMTLNSWNIPQVGILSFQINALNLYGTTRSTCGGFFQLGIDLNPNGMIAPWYVPGKNCIAHYFLPSRSPAIVPGIASPGGTHLTLTIEDDVNAGTVTMTIVDTSISQTFTTTFAYEGGPFYGMHTQLEWQPCCSHYPIEDYQFSGTLFNEQITTLAGATQPLTSDYMLPFTLDAPPQWDFTWYQNGVLGYNQVA